MGAQVAPSHVVHIVYDCPEPVAFTDNDPFPWGCDSSNCYGLVCCEGRRFESFCRRYVPLAHIGEVI